MVEELGIAENSLTTSRSLQSTLMHSFYGATSRQHELWSSDPRHTVRPAGSRSTQTAVAADGELASHHQKERIPMYRRLTLIAILTAVTATIAATPAAAKQSCGTERVQPGTSGPLKTGSTRGPGIPYKIIVWRGKVSCRKARSLIKATSEGRGTWHEAPDFAAIYTSFSGGWRCGPTGTGGGYGCVRGRRIGASGHADEIYGIQL